MNEKDNIIYEHILFLNELILDGSYDEKWNERERDEMIGRITRRAWEFQDAINRGILDNLSNAGPSAKAKPQNPFPQE